MWVWCHFIFKIYFMCFVALEITQGKAELKHRTCKKMIFFKTPFYIWLFHVSCVWFVGKINLQSAWISKLPVLFHQLPVLFLLLTADSTLIFDLQVKRPHVNGIKETKSIPKWSQQFAVSFELRNYFSNISEHFWSNNIFSTVQRPWILNIKGKKEMIWWIWSQFLWF